MDWKEKAIVLKQVGYSGRNIAKILGLGKSTVNNFFQKTEKEKYTAPEGVKILLLDVETAPLSGAIWSIWQQGISLNQIQNDWFILSYSASWLGSGEVMYEDLRGIVDKEDDTKLLQSLWNLLDEASIVVAHNGRKFDCKKINARLILNGFSKPSPYRIVDTLELVKKEFAFTSAKLEYLTDKLCSEKKQKHDKYPGYTLWAECLKDNLDAWKCMEEYNKADVTSLEELYHVLSSWCALPNYDVYLDDVDMSDWEETGYCYTNLAKYQVYRHKVTGQQKRGRVNLLTKEKRASLLANI